MRSKRAPNNTHFIPYFGLEDLVVMENNPNTLFVRLRDNRFKPLTHTQSRMADLCLALSQREVRETRLAYYPELDDVMIQWHLLSLRERCARTDPTPCAAPRAVTNDL